MRRSGRVRRLGGALALVAAAAVAFVREAVAEVAARPSSLEREVTFRAGRLELDPDRDHLELSENVVVKVDRYRLEGERLVLERTPRGITVEGSGRVAFCPCPEPPVTVGFRSALVAPPTDLLLEQPTVRVYGVPVFWLPYLWLRSPSRPGLLPPELAYRGEDGAFAATGVHVPVGEHHIDLTGGGYVEGGFEVRARHRARGASTSARLDHKDGSLLALDARGAKGEGDGGVAWSASALRGERALRGPGELEEVALRQDRAAVAAGASGGAIGGAVVLGADAARGGSLRSRIALGPGALLAVRTGLGRAAFARGDVSVATVQIGAAAGESRLDHEGELRAAVPAGPLLLEGELRSRATSLVQRDSQNEAGAAALGVTASVPLVKELGSGPRPLEHWVTPFGAAWVGASESSDDRVPSLVEPGVFFAALGGARTGLGATAGGRGAAAAELRGGLAGSPGGRTERVGAATITARAPIVSMRIESILSRPLSSTGGTQGGAAEPGGEVVLGHLELGRADAAVVAAHVEGLRGAPSPRARLLSGGWDAPPFAWLGMPGWSTGGTVGLPLTSWLRATSGADFDLTSGAWLGGRGALGYRHACGCLAASLWAGSRLGRRAPDVWLAIDLVP